MSGDTPQLSVIVYSRGPVANTVAVARALQSLEIQEHNSGMEILVADGTEDPALGVMLGRYPTVRHLRLPPRSMPWLKADAIRSAKGEIVAILDPTDVAQPGWVSELLAGFADTTVGAVGGSVVLDGPMTAANRAAFLFEYGAFNPPIADGPTPGDLPGNNVAYRRALLIEACGDILDKEGFNKPFCHDRIRAQGSKLVVRPAMQVRHMTAYRFFAFAIKRFHYGRCFGATRLRFSGTPKRWLYRVFAPAVPFLLIKRQIARSLGHAGNRKMFPGTVAALVGICIFWGVGEWVGCWFGAGRACRELY